MAIIQQIQKKQKRKNEFQNLQENCLMRGMKLLIFLKKGLFRIKIMYLKQKKKKESKEELKENKFFEYIENKSKGINYDLVVKHFNSSVPTVLANTYFS